MNKYYLPEVRIKDAWLLRDNASKHLHELWSKEGAVLADDDKMYEIVDTYKKAWQPYERKILLGMCDLLELKFYQNTIDVYIAPWFQAFSDPMVIGVTYKPDRFVEVLTHELCHRLLTDNQYNTEYPILSNEWTRLFGEDMSFGMRIHIPVHAMLQAIFDDTLHEPARTKNDKKLCQPWPDYKAAWDYVDEHGYKTIITKLKKSYKQLEKR